MKKYLLLALILCSMTLVLSCSSTYTFCKAHKLDNLSPNDVAYVKNNVKYNEGNFPEKVGVVILYVNGEAIHYNTPGLVLGAEILPGEHVLSLVLIAESGDWVRYDKDELVVKVKAGHTYLVEPILNIEGKDGWLLTGKLFWSPSIRDITGQEGDPRLRQKK